MGALDGQVAVVTGAGRGIGRAISYALAEQGSDCVVVSRTSSQLETTAQGVIDRGRSALVVQADVTDQQGIDTLVRRTLDQFGVWESNGASITGIPESIQSLYSAQLVTIPMPVVIALQEVQIRGRLDDRFIVRSLDGVVDSRFADFVHGQAIDYGGYLEARRVAFVLDRLPDGSGVCLRSGPADIYAVVKTRGC